MLAETQRLQTLAAMGIDVYLLRMRGFDTASASECETAMASSTPVADAGNAATLVVVCARSEDPHTARLHKVLPIALGIAASRIAWIEPDVGGRLAAPPPAAAYLALGTELARTLGEQLSTMQQMSSVIAVADAPHACLSNGLARRALWQALKPIARHLRRVAG